MKMNHDTEARYCKYLKILEQKPAYRSAFEESCDKYFGQEGTQMPIDTRLYLMTFTPTMISYVNWVLHQAAATGKNRLYFLSRDGYQMYLIAKRLVEMRKIPIECRYLYVSRFSMRIPEYYLAIEKSIDSICVGGIDVTPLKIVKRGGLTEEECRNTMAELGMEDAQNEILNYRQVLQFKEKLRTSRYLKKYVYRHSKESYSNAVGYLKQEGLCRDGDFAIVDSGWIGTLQRSVETLVQSVNPDIRVEGYYFGMYEYPPHISQNQFHAYYFSAKKGLNRKACFSNSLFETILSSEEGMTMRYEKTENGYVPVCDEQKNPNAGQMKGNIEALKLYLQQLDMEQEEAFDLKSDRKLVQQLMTTFMSNPTMLEYECYGKNLFSDDVLDGAYKEVAADLTWEQIKNQRLWNKLLIVAGIKRATIHESAWLEGSAVKASGGQAGKLTSELRHIRRYKRCIYFRKQLKRKFIPE